MDLDALYRPSPEALNLSLERLFPQVSSKTIWEGLFEERHAARVWFGSTLETELRPGGFLKWTGTWEGKTFEDRAMILACEDAVLLDALYFSGFSGLQESPETRQRLTIRLAAEGTGTRVFVEQGNFKDLASRDHSVQGWNGILEVAAQEPPEAT